VVGSVPLKDAGTATVGSQGSAQRSELPVKIIHLYLYDLGFNQIGSLPQLLFLIYNNN